MLIFSILLFGILYYGAPIILTIANAVILRQEYKKETSKILKKSTALTYAFLQHLIIWPIIFIGAGDYIEYAPEFIFLILIIIGLLIYALSSYFLLKYFLHFPKKLKNIYKKTLIQFSIFIAIYSLITFISLYYFAENFAW